MHYLVEALCLINQIRRALNEQLLPNLLLLLNRRRMFVNQHVGLQIGFNVDRFSFITLIRIQGLLIKVLAGNKIETLGLCKFLLVFSELFHHSLNFFIHFNATGGHCLLVCELQWLTSFKKGIRFGLGPKLKDIFDIFILVYLALTVYLRFQGAI